MMNEKYVNYALFLLEHNILKDEYYVEVKVYMYIHFILYFYPYCY